VHDLDSQDQPEHHELAGEVEGKADLSTLDDAGLGTEAKREVLRDWRQARRLRRDRSAIEIGRQLVVLGLLIVAALGATAVVLVGLVRESEGLVRVGLLALCALFGGALYRARTQRSGPR
jgi:hypothetical protein